jgi:hypothetical protein
MKKPLKHIAIRELLCKHPDGLSTKQICGLTGIAERVTRPALRKMADAYIDRWLRGEYQKPPEAIWCVVAVPEDCPPPYMKVKA